jgi:hypothetical protein
MVVGASIGRRRTAAFPQINFKLGLFSVCVVAVADKREFRLFFIPG